MAFNDDLCGALDNGDLRIAFMPTFSLHARRPVRFHFMARWSSRRSGILEYEEIKGPCERLGLRESFWDHYVERACSALALWRLHGKSLPVLSLNLPPRYLARRQLARFIDRMLSWYAVDPALLEVRLPSADVMALNPLESVSLSALRSMGIALGVAGIERLDQLPRVFATVRPDTLLFDTQNIRRMLPYGDYPGNGLARLLAPIKLVTRRIGCTLAVDGISSLTDCSE